MLNESKSIFYELLNESLKQNGISQETNINGRKQVFSSDLTLGESFEYYIIDYINENTTLTARKIEYNSVDYEKYNCVDIIVYREDKPYFLMDAKCLTCYMKKSNEFFNIPPENNIAINYYSLIDYQKNELPCYVLVYNQTNHPNNKAGFYIKDVKSIELDTKYVMKQKNKNGKGCYKFNLDNTTFKYYEDIEKLFDRWNYHTKK